MTFFYVSAFKNLFQQFNEVYSHRFIYEIAFEKRQVDPYLRSSAASPPELGVWQYNASNLKVQPSYGLWARHVMSLTVKNCSFNFEKPDNRYALFFDDVIGATITGIKMVKSTEINNAIKLKNSSDVLVENAVYYQDEWGE